MEYIYFISYTAQYQDNGPIFNGNVDVTISDPITSMEDIQKIEKELGKKSGDVGIVINNWKLLSNK